MTTPRPIPFGDWLPDLGSVDNPGATIAKNVLPQIRGYGQLKSLATFTDALGSACLGALWTIDDAGGVHNFAGDSSALYKLSSGSTWSDVSGVAAPYNANDWDFTKFGTRVIAVSKTDVTQKFDVGTDTTFGNLAGSPPQADRVATVRDFVMMGNIASLGENYVQWCGFNNSEIWTPSIQYQSDFQPLLGRSGAVQRIVPGEYGLIFTEQSIYIGEYAGPPVIFQFDEVERKKGTPAPNSVVWTGGLTWYYGWDGFYRFEGGRSVAISNNKVAKWFSSNAAHNALDTMRGAIDRVNGYIMWAFRSTASLSYNDRLIIYSIPADKWSYAEVDTEFLGEYLSPGYSLDDLDTLFPTGIDAASIPVDSAAYQGGTPSVLAFDSAHKAATFEGSAMTAVLETTELSKPDGSRVSVNNVRPVVEGDVNTSVTLQTGTRNVLTGNKAFTTAKAPNSTTGECNIRAKGRFMTHRANISGGFDNAFGVIPKEINTSGGKR